MKNHLVIKIIVIKQECIYLIIKNNKNTFNNKNKKIFNNKNYYYKLKTYLVIKN